MIRSSQSKDISKQRLLSNYIHNSTGEHPHNFIGNEISLSKVLTVSTIVRISFQIGLLDFLINFLMNNLMQTSLDGL